MSEMLLNGVPFDAYFEMYKIAGNTNISEEVINTLSEEGLLTDTDTYQRAM